MKSKSKKVLAMLLGCLITVSAALPESLTPQAANKAIVAFPGAVGGGKYATGGRGGTVYHVTNLNDSGEGSLRDAVSKSNRIVVFDVSGTIELKSNIVCTDNITIAGQTAPGGSGVTLKNYKFGMGGDNIIVRYLSSRPGPDNATSSGNDAWGGAKGSNSIVDHCSLGWTTDEQWGLYSNNDHYTVQYSVIGPANSWGGHVKGVHGFGLMMGRSNLTFDHNLICHNVSRNFRGKVVGTETADFTNNIIYDWGYQTAYGTIGHVNYVNNTLKAGNSTTGSYHYVEVQSSDNFMLYLSGNRILNKDNSVRNTENNNWSAISYKHSDKTRSNTESVTPFTIMQNGENISTALTAESAADAYDHVISHAGNGISSELRTKIDRQCVDDVKNGTGSCSGTDAFSSSESALTKYNIQCGVKYEYPSAVLKKTITDSDNDGMADDWEIARGLNPSDSSDYKGDYCGQGYMNIEYYINDLTVTSFPEGVVTPSPVTGSGKLGSVMDTAGKITLQNVNSKLFLEINAEAAADGVNVQQGNGDINGWKLQEAGNGYYYMYSEAGDGKYALTLDGGNAADGTNLSIRTANLSDAQQFKFVKNADGSYTITTKATEDKGCIGIASGSVENGANALQWSSDGSDNQKWTVAVKIDPINGTLIKKLRVLDTENYADWKIDTAKVGGLVFGDRDAVYTKLPDELIGAEVILTACDSKNSTSELASFIAAENMTAYAAFDTRVTTAPGWLSTWEKTSLTAENDKGVVFAVYSKRLSAGEAVTLGTNGQSSGCVGYTVFAAKIVGGITIGDVNADGKFDNTDVAALQKWLLSAPNAALKDWSAGDFNGDGKLDASDLCMIKRELLM